MKVKDRIINLLYGKRFLEWIWLNDEKGQDINFVIGIRKKSGKWEWTTLKRKDLDIVDKILEENKDADIYYGVLPRKPTVDNRKGSDEDIASGPIFFADFDFKKEEQCTPGIIEDYPSGKLELCYEEGGKTYHVVRPSILSLLLEVQKRGIPLPDFVIDSGNGYHFLWYYFELLDSISTPTVEEWKKKEEELIEKLKDLGADPQVKDPSRILRLPGSINQRSGRKCQVIWISELVKHIIKDRWGLGKKQTSQTTGVQKARPEEKEEQKPTQDTTPTITYNQNKEEKAQELSPPQSPEKSLNQLTEEERQAILEKHKHVVEALLPCFAKASGHRFEFTTHFSGWFERRGIPKLEAEVVLDELYRRIGKAPEHVRDVKYTYKKASEKEELTGLVSLTELCEKLGAPIDLSLLGVKPEQIEKWKKVKEEKKKEGEQGQAQAQSVPPSNTTGVEVQQTTGTQAVTLVSTQVTQTGEVVVDDGYTVKVYHDYDHNSGRPYVTVYYHVRVKEYDPKKRVHVMRDKVKWRIFTTDDNGNIIEVNEESLGFNFRHLVSSVKEYQTMLNFIRNLPKEVRPVRISEVYRNVLEFLKTHVVLSTDEDYALLSTWVIASYFIPIFDFFPYIGIEKMGFNSGGSTLLNALYKLLPRAMKSHNVTGAVIYHVVDRFGASLLVDELRTDVLDKETFEALYHQAIGCFERGARVGRVVGGEPYAYECYSPKVFVDQTLVFSHSDITSRTVFIRIRRVPTAMTLYNDDEGQRQALVDSLYSAFLLYAREVDKLYRDPEVDSGYRGREDQTFRPLVIVARVIDLEDPSLNVEEQVHKALEFTREYTKVVRVEGDPQKKVLLYVYEFLEDTIGPYLRKEAKELPSPWHRSEEGHYYIYLKDLVNNLVSLASSIYQQDLTYRPNIEVDEDSGTAKKGKALLTEREWRRIERDIQDYLDTRKLAPLLKKVLPRNIDDSRNRPILRIRDLEDYNKVIDTISDILGIQS